MGWRRLEHHDPRPRSFFTRRLDIEEPLGLHFTIGLILTLLGLSLFLLLSSYVLEINRLTAMDAEISSGLKGQARGSPLLTDVFIGITTLGDVKVLALLGGIVALVLLVLLWRRQIRYPLAAAWII